MRSRRPRKLFALIDAVAAVAALAVTGAAGCGAPTDTPDMGPPPDLAPPPALCKTPGALASPWFTDITQSALVGPNPGALPVATTLRAGDLDGDGYPDLIASVPSNNRDTDTMRTRFLYMNRPDPADATGRSRVFVDQTKESNLLATPDGQWGYSFGVANLGDVDNDGDLDVILGPGGDSSDPGAVLLNDGAAHFSFAPSSDVDQLVVGFGTASAVLFDFDRDGLLDYFPATFQYPPPNENATLLLKGAGDGRFTDVAATMGINTVPGPFSNGTNLPADYGVTACDLDMDGDPDLVLADYGREPDFVYRNDGASFSETGRSIGVAYDDRMDYSDNQSYRCYCQNRPGTCNPQPPDPVPGICTAFGVGNDGRGWYPGQDDQVWRLGGNTFSFACGDIDDDGDMDLMSAEIRHGDVGSSSDPTELVLNPTPPGQPLQKFVRPGNVATGIDRPESGIDWNEGDQTPVLVNLDNDGRKDIFLASSDYPGNHGWAWHQKPDWEGTVEFENVTAMSGLGQKQAHGVVFADFDRDGDVDAAIGTSTARGGAPTMAIHVYRNEIGQDQNWVQVQLVGAGAGHTNASAIGALVRVTAGGRTQMQEVSGGYGLSSTQNDLVLTFGLGATCTIDAVEVRWLDGNSGRPNTVSTFHDVRANYRVRIREGEERVEYLF